MLNMIFKELGLTDRESSIYLYCLKNDEATVSSIGKESGLSRSTVYYVLDILKKHQLLYETEINNKIVYHSESPEKLREILLNRKRSLTKSLKSLTKSIPMLKQDNKMSVKMYKGTDKIREMYTMLYEKYAKTEVCIFSSVQDYQNEETMNIFRDMIDIRLKYKVRIKGISPFVKEKANLRHIDKQQLRESRFIDPLKFPITSDFLIFKDLVCLIINNEHDLCAIILEDKDIVKTFRVIFDLAWDGAERYDKKFR